jgi:RHS repeat-associated protein
MLGSVRTITNSAGAVTECYDYLPFGRILSSSDNGRSAAKNALGGNCHPANPNNLSASNVDEKFTAKKRDDETGLDFFEARYMSAPLGRFMSPDPVAGRLANPQSLNRYTYVLNNPLKFIDPTGMIVEWADSEEECKKGETECKTKAQRSFENELNKKLNSKNESVRNDGKALSETYNQLQNSEAVFRVVADGSTSESRGNISYDGNVFTISLKGNASAYGALSNNQKLAHEFEHGRQVLNGELSFHNLTTGAGWLPFVYDRTDEAKAFAAGFAMEPLNPQQQKNKFLSGLNSALTGGISAGANYLEHSGPYRGLPPGPDNVKIVSPSIYQVPK